MGFHNRRRLFLVILVHLGAAPIFLWAQPGGDAAYQAKRHEAVELFNHGQRLQALPLLEELAQGNPKDDAVLVDLAASLVDHAATLTDAGAAAKERFRARDLLDQAWNLGNTSPLAQNLSQLLKQLPDNGSIKFSDNPTVEQVMNAGEAAFARRDFAEAIKNYAKALELEPKNYAAALFTGNTYDKMNDFSKAGEWYERAIQLGPNIETAYRYYADMLAKEGDMAKSRSMLIQAAVAEPYNKIVWRELHAWATINHTDINLIYLGIPPTGKDAETLSAKYDPQLLAVVTSAWKAYHAVKAKWQAGEFQKRFPQETEYRHTLVEEASALSAEAQVLEKLKEDKQAADHLSQDQALGLLLKLYDAGLVEAYTLFSLGDSGIARDYAPYRAQNRAKLEEYMDKFVVPPAPARP